MYIYIMYFIGDINIYLILELMRNMGLIVLYKIIFIYDSIYFK